MGRIRFGVPEYVLAAVRAHTDVRTAVETGTYRGEIVDDVLVGAPAGLPPLGSPVPRHAARHG